MAATIREGISLFLKSREAESPFLISKWYPNLESQFLVHEGSNPTDGGNGWTDGEETWYPHRWPHNAGSDPHYNDRTLTFSPGAHLKRFGSTWWDWVSKRSVAVVLDIDLEGEHAKSTTTVTPEQLNVLVERLKSLPYLTLVRSSGGNGVHIYAFFDEAHQPAAANHFEHAQVGEAVVAKIGEDLDYNFRQHMDAIGVVFWMWSCDSPADHPGYSVIQEQTEYLKDKDVEKYRELQRNPNRPVTVRGFTDDGLEVESTQEGGGYKVYPLEPIHIDILKEIEAEGFSFVWNKEYNMAHTHTVAIKRVFEKRAAEGRPLKGLFQTISHGSDQTKPNCFITPRPGGKFLVRRHGRHVSEHLLWSTKDEDTWCYLNEEVAVLRVMKKLASSYDGTRMVFEPKNLEMLLKAFGHTLGDSVGSLPSAINVTVRKNGTMYASFKGSGSYEGWRASNGQIVRDLPLVHKDETFCNAMLDEADEFVRHVVTPDNEPYGWALKTDKSWVVYPGYDPVSCVVTQVFGKDAFTMRAEMTKNPWKLCHLPFGKEYPGGRLWNKDAPQLAIEPASSPGPHPHWDKIMNHLGTTLDDVVATTEWCQQWGINSGADYLMAWIAYLIKEPTEPLPYLFFYGPQDAGKSIFHESLTLLFSSGITSLNNALVSGAGYNYEVSKAVLGYVEEKDLSSQRELAYARIKEWLLAKYLTIHKKNHTPYQQQNTLHIVQTANSPTSCPMEDGDTRITAILVRALNPSQMVPRKIMYDALEAEAPYFLRTLMSISLPESHTRLRVPMLASEDKKDLESINQTPFEEFCSRSLHPCPGHVVSITDFCAEYKKFLDGSYRTPEKRSHIIQLLRNRGDRYIIGIKHNQNYIANVSLDPDAEPKKVPLTVNEKGRLVRAT